jgi:hypothetical protein
VLRLYRQRKPVGTMARIRERIAKKFHN